ncbi:YraN family protein [Marispirochaeta sp.]|jgi:putative endonuclease|uniref:YraN family protein n=1 Tax=Marispirochaeta sp. TaxID=2038653 RepID=UPI0029C7BEDD|nr:YraN family protein [Marispirochaeta sp.]
MNRSQRGRSGERDAAEYLQKLGHDIVKQNYYTRNGEIDLITRIDDRLHFVEVKTWRLSPENLEFSIDNRKIHRIQCTARDFLAKNDRFRNCEKQFDVVYITEPDHSVHYIPQAFEGGAE